MTFKHLVLVVVAAFGVCGSVAGAVAVEGETSARGRRARPSLAELDAKAEWQPMPVVDAAASLREQWRKTKPETTVAEALALRNDGDRANARILDALGRPAETPERIDYDATFTRRLAGEVSSTNPLLLNSVADGDLGSYTGFGLFGFDWNLRPFGEKDSIVSWHVSKDRLYDKVVLRDDCTWSDGRPITAHDVAFSYRLIMDPRVPIPAVRSMTAELGGVEAYDDRTVVFFHKFASPTNVLRMSFPIVPKHVYEVELDADPTLRESDYHRRLENEPIVGGPYRIVRRVPGKELELERRDSYFMHQGKQVREKPAFKTVRFFVIPDQDTALVALQSGVVDETVLTPQQWRESTDDEKFYKRNTKARGIEWVYFYFGWNTQRDDAPFFADVKVRRAMGYAFDHEAMLKEHCFGLYEPSMGIFHPTAPMASKNTPAPLKRDLAKAKQLLEEAGWKDSDGDGLRDKRIDGKRVPFAFTMICSNIPQRIAICELLEDNLQEIGIECRVSALAPQVMSSLLLQHEYQANFGGWGTGADPSTLKNIWRTGEDRNFNQYSNKEVDRLLAEADAEFDTAKRYAMYGKIEELIYTDQPVTFLYNQSSFYGFNKRLRGYKFSPRGPFHYSPGAHSLWKELGP